MKNKILSILLSVAVAVGLWVYVVTEVDPEYARTYKVEVDPTQFQYHSVLEERNLLVMECDEYVTVRLKGNRSTLAAIRSEDLALQASVANVTKAGEYQLDYKVNIPGAILVEEQLPERISLRVDDEITKELDVKAEIVGEVPESFSADTDNIFPKEESATITVVGPSAVIKNIAYAKLDGAIDLTGKEEDVIGEYELVLCDKTGKPADAEGITILGSKKIAVRVRIEMFKDLKLELDLTEGGGLTEANVTMDHTTIRVSGPKAAIEPLGDTLMVGKLDLSTLDMKQTLEPFPIVLKDDRLVNRSGIEEVSVTVDFGDLTQKTVYFQKFDIIPPTDLTVEVDAQIIKAILRGPADLLESIAMEDMNLIVDYRDASVGTGVIRKPKLTMNSAKFQNVVMVSADEVTATVK